MTTKSRNTFACAVVKALKLSQLLHGEQEEETVCRVYQAPWS